MVSPEMQLTQVRALAARHGEDPATLVVLEELNVSGTKRNRAKFQELLAAIRADLVSNLYSYSLSRLSRSIRDIDELVTLCYEHGVAIHLSVDPDPDPTTPSGRLIIAILSAMAQFEADVASERARDTVEQRRARGDRIGPRRYGEGPEDNVEAVVETYKRVRSIIGTARALTDAKIPTRNGKHQWQATSVRTVLRRVAPELLPIETTQGASKAAPFMFARLLRCRCGKYLTGVRYRSGVQQGYVVYRCLMGRTISGHGPQSVPETTVLAWAAEEASLLHSGGVEALIGGGDTAEQRAAVQDHIRRLNKAFVNGMPEDEYDAELESARAELARLESSGRIVKLHGVRWDREPQTVNDQLRALWEYVEMDGQERPVRAVWRVPEWRRPPVRMQGSDAVAAG
jgi:DNA invertase Pin-like site-specific DNA recombinase